MDGPAASSAGAGPSASSDAGRHSSLMPLKKRAAASAAAAREAALAIVHDDDDDDRHGRHGRGAVTSGASQVLHRRWEPRTSDAALSWVAIFVLARLRRRNAPLSSESMLPVALTALSQQPNAPRGLGLTDAGPALVDTLRVLVRIGFVARRRATPLGDGGRGRAAGLPMYALSSYGQEQLFTAVQARGTNKAAPHGVGSGAIGGPAIGAPAIGSAGGGAHPGRPTPQGGGGAHPGRPTPQGGHAPAASQPSGYAPAASQPRAPPSAGASHAGIASPGKPMGRADPTPSIGSATAPRSGGATAAAAANGAGGGSSGPASKAVERVASNTTDADDDGDKLKRTASEGGGSSGAKASGGKYRISRKRSA
jgi:hypothetical protein